MPNKYNFKTMNLKFNPTNGIKNNIIEIGIDEDYKKEPVMQITGANDTQLLYYYGKILIYKYNEVKFFVVELSSDKNPNMYIVFDITSGSTTPTDNTTAIGNIMGGIVDASGILKNTESTISNVDFNSMLKDKKITRGGNLFYVGKVTVSYPFPTTANAASGNLPEALKNLTAVPTWDEVNPGFSQEEIQWVLDCNLLGEDGDEKVSLASDKNAYKYFVSGLSIAIVLFFIYIAAINWSSILTFFSKYRNTKISPYGPVP